MAAIAAPSSPSPLGTGGADHDDSNISSPLSDVDDKDTNDDEIVHMQLDLDAHEEDSSLSGAENDAAPNDASDSDSVLSDANSDIHTNSDANDTEAETERLYDTPRIQRQRDVVVDQFNEGQIFEHTPSKLRRTATLDHISKGHNDSLSGDDVSVVSSPGDNIESPTKPATTQNTSVDEDARRDSYERKRKRSPVAEPSDSDQPLRKRTGSIVAAENTADDDSLANEDDTTPGNILSRNRTPVEEDEASPRKHDEIQEDDAPERATRSTKKITRNGARRKGRSVEGPTDDALPEAIAEPHDVGTEDDAGQQDEEMDADAEEEAEAAAKNLEELERKQAAFKDWSQIEEMFGIFRDRLYKDRLQTLEEEEQSLLADVPTHHEYLNMKQCIDDRLNQKLQESSTEYDFRIKALENKAVAQRAQVWSQYFQAIREKREHALETLNREWYDVHKARRTAHSLPDFGLLFPKDPMLRVRNAVAYNTEVSTLAGIAKYEGFPAGPELRGATILEVEDDFSIIERGRRGRQKQVTQPREEFQTSAFSRLGPAGEQFLKDTPWANPNHSSHKIHQSAPAQPDARLVPAVPTGRQIQHVPTPASAAERKASLDALSAMQRSPALGARLSDSPELARTMLGAGAHQMKRVGSIPSIGRGSKATAA